MLSFRPFHVWAAENKIKKMDLRERCGFGSKTAAKIWNDEFPIRSDIIEKMCEKYNLRIEQIIEYKEG